MDSRETGCNRILKHFYYKIVLSPGFPFSLLTKRFPSGKGQFLFPFSRFFYPLIFVFLSSLCLVFVMSF